MWIKLPSGKYLNMAFIVEVSPDERHGGYEAMTTGDYYVTLNTEDAVVVIAWLDRQDRLRSENEANLDAPNYYEPEY